MKITDERRPKTIFKRHYFSEFILHYKFSRFDVIWTKWVYICHWCVKKMWNVVCYCYPRSNRVEIILWLTVILWNRQRNIKILQAVFGYGSGWKHIFKNSNNLYIVRLSRKENKEAEKQTVASRESLMRVMAEKQPHISEL